MSEVLVEVDGLWKKYCRDLRTSLSYGLRDLANECTGQPVGDELRPKEFWALQDISIELKRGQCLGLIGGNGAGKSTLLKIISGLVKPTRGTVCVQGTIQALIELGAGFHPALSGRENILINAAVLGIPHEDIKKKLDEIIEFAELQDFIDAPIQSYSSGMRARLGFAIAMQVKPDLLIIDEVLSVGDGGFREKCREAVKCHINSNRGAILVTHNMRIMENFCTRGVYLNNGNITKTGPLLSLIDEYERISTGIQFGATNKFNKKFEPIAAWVENIGEIKGEMKASLCFRMKSNSNYNGSLNYYIEVFNSRAMLVGFQELHEPVIVSIGDEREVKIEGKFSSLSSDHYYFRMRVISDTAMTACTFGNFGAVMLSNAKNLRSKAGGHFFDFRVK